MKTNNVISGSNECYDKEAWFDNSEWEWGRRGPRPRSFSRRVLEKIFIYFLNFIYLFIYLFFEEVSLCLAGWNAVA